LSINENVCLRLPQAENKLRKKRLREILAQQRGLGHFEASLELGLHDARDASPPRKKVASGAMRYVTPRQKDKCMNATQLCATAPKSAADSEADKERRQRERDAAMVRRSIYGGYFFRPLALRGYFLNARRESLQHAVPYNTGDRMHKEKMTNPPTK